MATPTYLTKAHHILRYSQILYIDILKNGTKHSNNEKFNNFKNQLLKNNDISLKGEMNSLSKEVQISKVQEQKNRYFDTGDSVNYPNSPKGDGTCHACRFFMSDKILNQESTNNRKQEI